MPMEYGPWQPNCRSAIREISHLLFFTDRCTLSYVIYVYPAHNDIPNLSKILCNLCQGLSSMFFFSLWISEWNFVCAVANFSFLMCVLYGRTISPFVISPPWQYLKKSTTYGAPHYTNFSRSRVFPPFQVHLNDSYHSFLFIERNAKNMGVCWCSAVVSPIWFTSDMYFGRSHSLS
jgi:ABC-type transport system involved in multi-copper enzyme maturation permease subunit